jgi:DNA-binding GntR family transcriptional regulator
MNLSALQNHQPVKLTRANVVTELQELIKEWVFSRKLSAGDRINESVLSEHLGISRGPIREALQALRQEGLVEIIPNRGAFLRTLTLKEVLDLYDVRAGLAHTAGRLLAHRISVQDVEALKDMHEKMEWAVNNDEPLVFFRQNLVFHDLLFKAARNRSLLEMVNGIEKRVMLYLHREATDTRMLKDSNEQHQQILDTIGKGDSQAVADAFLTHVLFGKQRLIDQLEE